MTHMSLDELVDLLEGRGSTRAALHVERCAHCRDRHRELSDMLAAVASVNVPEPSPLFWQHLSARVREAVAAEPAPSRRWRWSLGFGVPAVAMVGLVVALVSSLVVSRGWAPATPPLDAVMSVPTSMVPDGEQAGWDVMLSMAEDLAWEDLTGQGLTRVGTADRAVLDLTADEREELARVLRAELQKGRSS